LAACRTLAVIVHILQLINLKWWVGPDLGSLYLWAGSGPLQKKKKDYSGPRSAQPFFWAEIDPSFFLAELGPCIFTIYILFIIIYNIKILKKTKNFKKKFQKSFEKNCDFLKYFSTNFA
jgi:hypothetical protein